MEKALDFRKEDFLPSGSAELPPIYFRSSAAGARKAIGGTAFFCFINGVGHSFVWKDGIVRLKDELLSCHYEDLEKEFELWKQKWDAFDSELYTIATTESFDLKTVWARLDKISTELWLEAYKAEALDNFSEEIELMLKKKLKEKEIDVDLLHEIISPDIYTRTQQTVHDLKDVLSGQMSRQEYIRKNWFSHGSWAGGELMDEELLAVDLEHITDDINFSQREEIQKKAENLLDNDTMKIIKLIRLLSLWREERKANIQKYCLGYKKIAEMICKQHKIDLKMAEWLLEEDLEKPLDEKEINQRFDDAILAFTPEREMGEFLPKVEAKKIIAELFVVKMTQEIKGMVASKGIARGTVKLVLKNEDFGKFCKGDILVTNMTRPEFLPLMKKAAAIVTDDGGLTCHAAIVARELKKPCVIGTKIATKVLKDGEIIEADADKGIIKII